MKHIEELVTFFQNLRGQHILKEDISEEKQDCKGKLRIPPIDCCDVASGDCSSGSCN